MYSIKFFKDNNEHVFSAPHYSILRYDDGIVGITMYKDYLEVGGIERLVSKDDFDVCYIENLAGKTVDRIVVKK